MLNNVSLVGRLTKDPELRYTENNKANVLVSLAVERDFKSQNGEREADFISLVFWGKTAELLATYTSKGRLISVTGRLQSRSYDKDGQRIFVTEVVVNSFNMLDKKPEGAQGAAPAPQGGYQQQPQQPNFGNQQNYQQNYQQPQNPFGATNPLDISDDDLPF